MDNFSEAGSEILREDDDRLPLQDLLALWNIDPLGIPLYRGRAAAEGDNDSLLSSEISRFTTATSEEQFETANTGFARNKASYGSLISANEGITLSWRDMSVYVKQKQPWFKKSPSFKPFKRVLNNVSGVVRPGSLVALMGASGAGKSTLMNALAQRTPREVIVDGDILFNGFPVYSNVSNISGYVHQHDLFVGSLTVKEHLTFMARLRMDKSLSMLERNARVNELLKELGLTKAQNTRIGIPNMEKCISGGERKRLAFASEIITDPPLLFCDEPTSGLDSFNAKKLVRMMKEMAARGKTILCTIHQPNSEVYAMFDRLLLIAEGRIAFMGTTKGALEFFESLGHRCPPTFNPADFYIHSCAVLPGHEISSRDRIKRICDNYAVSVYAKDIDLSIQHQTMLAVSQADANLMEEPFLATMPRKPGLFIQFYWLLWRCLLDSYRNPSIHVFRTLQKIAMAIMIGLCFTNIEFNQAGIQNIGGALFIFITENSYPSIYGVLNTFPSELPVFMREHKNGIYAVGPYYSSKMLSLIPGFLIDSFLFCLICYWMVGLRPEAFPITAAMSILVANVASACGAMFSATFENISIIMLVLIPLDVVLFISGGLFISLETLSPWIKWVRYLSWFMYSNEAMTIAQWSGARNISCEFPPGLPCIETGEEVIESYNFEKSHLILDFAYMLTLFCLFHSIGYLGLSQRAKKK